MGSIVVLLYLNKIGAKHKYKVLKWFKRNMVIIIWMIVLQMATVFKVWSGAFWRVSISTLLFVAKFTSSTWKSISKVSHFYIFHFTPFQRFPGKPGWIIWSGSEVYFRAWWRMRRGKMSGEMSFKTPYTSLLSYHQQCCYFRDFPHSNPVCF